MRADERIREIFRKSQDASREYLNQARRCSLRGWPDRKRELDTAFELQVLLLRRHELRFEYLMKMRLIQSDSWPSLLEFTKRLNDGWRDTELTFRTSRS